MVDETSSRKRETNRFIREGLTALHPDEQIAFFCECVRADCYQVVWLSGAEYDRLKADDAWRALAPVHGAEGEPLRWPERTSARPRRRVPRIRVAR